MPVTKYFWDPVEDNVIEEYDENGDTIVEYTTEPDEFGNLISQHRDGATSYYHYDGQGNTLALTDEAGDATDTYAYNAFGETTASSGNTTNPYRYIGQKGYQYDSETSGYYVRARNYQSAISRWTAKDPIGNGSGSNLFQFASSIPKRYLDPYRLIVFLVRPGSVRGLDSDGPNYYAYVRNQPVNRVDASGLQSDPSLYSHCVPPTTSSWDTPPGPDCDNYDCSPFLKSVCNSTGNGNWSNCVRGCLLAAFDPVNCKYRSGGGVLRHLFCWTVCDGQIHGGPGGV